MVVLRNAASAGFPKKTQQYARGDAADGSSGINFQMPPPSAPWEADG